MRAYFSLSIDVSNFDNKIEGRKTVTEKVILFTFIFDLAYLNQFCIWWSKIVDACT